MLYSIIPPILVVLSLAAIIVFVAKKSKKIANLELDENPEERFAENRLAESSRMAKVFAKIKNVKNEDIKHFGLAFLEQITRRSRLLFLKLEMQCAGWSSYIREKRKKRAEKKTKKAESMEVANAEKESAYKEEEFVRRRDGGSEEKAGSAAKTEKGFSKFSLESLKERKTGALPPEPEEKVFKPIISDKIVSPRPRAEIRDRLEELLVERIAVNPRDIEAYERLGEYYLEIGNFADSKECFKQVLKLNPGNRNAKYRMRRLENLLAGK